MAPSNDYMLGDIANQLLISVLLSSNLKKKMHRNWKLVSLTFALFL